MNEGKVFTEVTDEGRAFQTYIHRYIMRDTLATAGLNGNISLPFTNV